MEKKLLGVGEAQGVGMDCRLCSWLVGGNGETAGGDASELQFDVRRSELVSDEDRDMVGCSPWGGDVYCKTGGNPSTDIVSKKLNSGATLPFLVMEFRGNTSVAIAMRSIR